MSKFNSIAGTILICAALGACVPTQGRQMIDWDSAPGKWPSDAINARAAETIHQKELSEAARRDRVSGLKCGPFSIDLRADKVSFGLGSNALAGDNSPPFYGFVMVISAQSGFAEPIRFRRWLYPDKTARIFYKDDGKWTDVTNPGLTSEPPDGTETFRDVFFGFDPSTYPEAFHNGKMVESYPWSEFYRRSIHWNNGSPNPPKGAYRVEFLVDYEIEWRGGRCSFRLPDMEFEYR